jgi:type II secretory pathway predicted ATPase ExeA
MEYWGLHRDPFREQDCFWVSLPGHQEAVARLLYTIDAGQRLVVMDGPSGTGKSRVLRQVVEQARKPSRRFARFSGPIGGEGLVARLASGLGATTSSLIDGANAWRSLERSVQLMGLQGLQVVLAIDAQSSGGPEDRALIHRLGHLGESTGTLVSVLLVMEEGVLETAAWDWTLAVRLKRLLRSEVERYLNAKLEDAGCGDGIFTPRALTRLHLLSDGGLRGVDRLASLCLIAGATRGVEAVSSDLVDAVACECRQPMPYPVFRS